MVNAGTIIVHLHANTINFEKGVKRAQESISRMDKLMTFSAASRALSTISNAMRELGEHSVDVHKSLVGFERTWDRFLATVGNATPLDKTIDALEMVVDLARKAVLGWAAMAAMIKREDPAKAVAALIRQEAQSPTRKKNVDALKAGSERLLNADIAAQGDKDRRLSDLQQGSDDLFKEVLEGMGAHPLQTGVTGPASFEIAGMATEASASIGPATERQTEIAKEMVAAMERLQNTTQSFVGSVGGAVSVFASAGSALASGDVGGAVATAVSGMLQSSASFTQLQETSAAILEELGAGLEPLVAAVIPLVSVVGEIAALLTNSLKPVFDVLGAVLVEIAQGLAFMINTIIEAIAALVGAVDEDAARAIRRNLIDVDLEETSKSLEDTADAAEKATRWTNQNLAAGYDLNLARYGVAGAPGTPSWMVGGGDQNIGALNIYTVNPIQEILNELRASANRDAYYVNGTAVAGQLATIASAARAPHNTFYTGGMGR